MSVELLHSPADILQALLVQLGEAADPSDSGTAGWPCYVSQEPPSPDEVLIVHDADWLEDGRSMIDGETFHHYGAEVFVRGLSQNRSFAKAMALHRAMDEDVYDELITISGTQYLLHSISGTRVFKIGTGGETNQLYYCKVPCNFVVDRKN